MNYFIESLVALYPQVVRTVGEDAFDKDGKLVSYDHAAVQHHADLSAIRQIRNRLLTETDWTQSRDITLPNDAEWIDYRQALRDLPANTVDPANPVWPTKPQ